MGLYAIPFGFGGRHVATFNEKVDSVARRRVISRHEYVYAQTGLKPGKALKRALTVSLSSEG